ncbi:MAG: glycosyltransferase family 2 protein [Methylococcales bacterium]|nr:glycosyltransferase family 2 protein [Methylococcales bacterium]
MTNTNSKIAVVIPSYKVRNHILGVISQIGRIYDIDDCCPDGSGDFVESNYRDERVWVIRNPENQSVGGTVMSGYQAAIAGGRDIIVKVDGYGQMDPRLIPDFVALILDGEADYTKGNHFFDLEEIHAMPKVRIVGNAALTFMTKLSPAIGIYLTPPMATQRPTGMSHGHLPFKKISRRNFLETDMLIRLNTLRAVVVDFLFSQGNGWTSTS